MNRSEMLKKLIVISFVTYLIVSIIMIVAKGIFAFIEGEPMLENIMLNIRNYVFALPSIDGKYLVTIFNNIGILRCVAILFFSFFFFLSIYDEQERNLIVIAVIVVILGIVLCIYTNSRFPFGMLEGLILSSIIYIIEKIITIFNINTAPNIRKIEYNTIKVLIILFALLHMIYELYGYFA